MLRKYLIKFFFFALFGFVSFALTCELIMVYPTVFEKMAYPKKWFKVYRIAAKSHQNIGSDTLYLGDSVGAQFFPYTQQKNYMPINGAVLMPGQYILMANAIDANPKLKQIFLVCKPQSIGMKAENLQACNNFVKPFYHKENFKHLTKDLRARIERPTFAKFYQYHFIKFLPFSDINYAKGVYDPNILSPTAIVYLKKMIDLCEKEGITFEIVSPPITKEKFISSNNWAIMRDQIKSEKLESAFKNYFDSIAYLPADKFADGVHLKPQFIANHRQQLLAFLNKKNG